MLYEHPDTKKDTNGNTYWTWIENYVGDDYVDAVKLGSGMFFPARTRVRDADVENPTALLEKHMAEQTPQRVEELVKIFIHATKVRYLLSVST